MKKMEGKFWLNGADEMVIGQFGLIPFRRGSGGRGPQSTNRLSRGGAGAQMEGGWHRGHRRLPRARAGGRAASSGPASQACGLDLVLSMFLFRTITPTSGAPSSWQGIGLALMTLL